MTTGRAGSPGTADFLNLLLLPEPEDLPPRKGPPAKWPYPGVPRYLWKYQRKPRLVLFARSPDEIPNLELLPLPDRMTAGGIGFRRSVAVSLLVHSVLLAGLLLMPRSAAMPEEMQLALRFNRPTPLVAPPPGLIQELTGGAAARELNLEQLQARPVRRPSPGNDLPPGPPSPPVQFVPPAPEQPVQKPLEPLPEPPKITPSKELPPVAAEPGQGKQVLAPPPQIQPEENHPILAFEKPGAMTTSPSTARSSGVAREGKERPSPLRRPLSPVKQAIEEVVRSGGGGKGLVIGDLETANGIIEAHNVPPSSGNSGSNLKLLSDPKGIDFRPYLIRILATVRRNWRAVIPASAKLGRRGKVVIQFAIDRSGAVPKLVIAVPSGMEALDRAAVAGISASNPFPPLPEDYPGDEVRLQFNFLYNIKRK